MEKVKVTREQAEAIVRYKGLVNGVFDFLHDLAGARYIKSTGEEQEAEAIKLMRAYTDGYEVEEEFKVGDWITNDSVKQTAKVERLYDKELCADNLMNGYVGAFRLATPEEIAQEKERRWWAKLNRKPNEYKLKDIVSTGSITRPVNYLFGHGELGIEGMEFGYKPHEIFLVCPAENRLDGETNG